MIKQILVKTIKIRFNKSFEFFIQGGLRQGKAFINGFDVFKSLKYECGVHRIQRVPQTEKSGRIHTSTAMVAVLPQPKDVSKMIV
jgi:peptide chain release factor 1